MTTLNASAAPAETADTTAVLATKIAGVVRAQLPGDQAELAVGVAAALIERLHLHASVRFTDRTAVPAVEFRTITGRLDEVVSV